MPRMEQTAGVSCGCAKVTTSELTLRADAAADLRLLYSHAYMPCQESWVQKAQAWGMAAKDVNELYYHRWWRRRKCLYLQVPIVLGSNPDHVRTTSKDMSLRQHLYSEAVGRRTIALGHRSNCPRHDAKPINDKLSRPQQNLSQEISMI